MWNSSIIWSNIIIRNLPTIQLLLCYFFFPTIKKNCDILKKREKINFSIREEEKSQYIENVKVLDAQIENTIN